MKQKIDAKTLTRNWNELLQELRVLQTGVQILTGFLLTVPFSSRFTDLADRHVTTYLVVLSGAVLTTCFVTAPVAFHRILFRRRQREWLVEAANISARIGLASMALTSSGVLFLVFDVVLGLLPAILAAAGTVVFFAGVWGAAPVISNRGRDRWDDEDSSAEQPD